MLYSGTILLIVAFFVGYLVNIKNQKFNSYLHNILDYFTLSILFVLGYELGMLDNLFDILSTAGNNVIYFIVVVGSINILALLLLFPLESKQENTNNAYESTKFIWLFVGALKYVLVVFLGALVAILSGYEVVNISEICSYLLVMLLFIVGVSIRSNNISLTTILFNRRGFKVSSVVIISSLFGGYLCTYLIPIDVNAALAVASGFGWYTLSGVIVGNKLGPALGSTVFLFDLIRELLALTLIPIMMRFSSATAIGFSGATALDFTLPIIERTGGAKQVPVALSSGFILTILSPVLMLFFLSWGN